MGLGPSQPPEGFDSPRRRVSSKLGLDVTHRGRYPAPALPPKEHLDAVRAAWAEHRITQAGR